MFWCKVALGNQEILKANDSRCASTLGNHSNFISDVDNKANSGKNFNEYIIFRYGQAIPIAVMQYSKR